MFCLRKAKKKREWEGRYLPTVFAWWRGIFFQFSSPYCDENMHASVLVRSMFLYRKSFDMSSSRLFLTYAYWEFAAPWSIHMSYEYTSAQENDIDHMIILYFFCSLSFSLSSYLYRDTEAMLSNSASSVFANRPSTSLQEGPGQPTQSDQLSTTADALSKKIPIVEEELSNTDANFLPGVHACVSVKIETKQRFLSFFIVLFEFWISQPDVLYILKMHAW